MILKNKKFVSGIILLFLFAAMIVLLKTVDTAIYAEGSGKVGFYTLNGKFADLIGVNETAYDISEYLGHLSIGFCLFFAFRGFTELVYRKSFFKVDWQIYLLACLYIVTMVSYGFFYIVHVNDRPIMTDGIFEASFPSSHTVLSIVSYASAIFFFKKAIRSKKINRIIIPITAVLLVTQVTTRTASGYHWLTDIISGLLLSFGFLLIFMGLYEFITQKTEKTAH